MTGQMSQFMIGGYLREQTQTGNKVGFLMLGIESILVRIKIFVSVIMKTYIQKSKSTLSSI